MKINEKRKIKECWAFKPLFYSFLFTILLLSYGLILGIFKENNSVSDNSDELYSTTNQIGIPIFNSIFLFFIALGVVSTMFFLGVTLFFIMKND
jgi:NADH:ubiquinone oxidoreductase subunit 6 (subunit J)